MNHQEDIQLQQALKLSEEEFRRTAQAREAQNDYDVALKLQEQELGVQTNNPSPRRRRPISRLLGALINTVVPAGRYVGSGSTKRNGSGVLWNGRLYHPECHEISGVERCHVCFQNLPHRGNRVTWCEHPFWKQKYCPFHDHDSTPRCASCERHKPNGMHGPQWVILSDGREICADCSRSMIVDTNACQPLYMDVLELYRSLQLQLPTVPPLMLVDRLALNERSPVQGHGGSSQTRGMTLAEEYRSVRTVFKRRGPFFGMGVDSYPVEHRECRVAAILILFGLPRLLTGSILAHECMHAYLKLSNKTDLTPTVEEGLCQLMAYLWIERQQPADMFEKTLASFIANQIRVHPSPVYGDGFRMALASFQCYGLPNLINHVKLTGLFPEPCQSR